MPREIFLIPIETVVSPRGDGSMVSQPRHVRDPAVIGFGSLRYSNEDSSVVMINSTQVYLDVVAAQTDATRLATEGNLDEVLTVGQANTAKTIFEAAFIPGQFINEGDTRREAIRSVVGMFLFSQRMEGRFGQGWRRRAQDRGVTLDSIWQTFPPALQNELIEIRDDHGWTNAELGVTNTSTLREILQAISQQFESTPISIGGLQI